MNDNKRKNGFSLIKMILACLVILLFLFIVMWMIKKSSPNLDPIYDGIFRENINNMQDAGEAYFTTDKLPTEIGEEVKITLQEMLDKNYILPFTDKNGDTCDLNKSYVLVVKTKDGYELRTFLKCGDESHQIVKVLGCHDLCTDCNKEKTCTVEKITQYQFVKDQKVTKETYSCAKGKLDGKNCIITNIDVKPALVKTTTKTDIKTATVSTTKTKVDTIIASVKVDVKPEVTTTPESKVKVDVKPEVTTTPEKKVKVDVTPEKTTTPEKKVKVDVTPEKSESTNRIYTDPYKKVETTCVTVKEKDPNCTVQCVPTYIDGKFERVCNTCGYVYHKKCTDTDVWVCPDGYDDKGSGSSKQCYKDEKVTTYKCPSNISKENQSGSGANLKCWYYNITPAKTTYKCPSNISSENQSGSGANLKCWYYEITPAKTTYKCPSNISKENQSGSGANLKCWYYEVTPGKTTYKCPSYVAKENQSGSGANLKCWTYKNDYTCPSNANQKEGSGKDLKCYVVKTDYSCDTTNGWSLKNKNCYKTTSVKTEYCEKGYDLANSKCSKKDVSTVKAEVEKTTSTKKVYKWSQEESLSGWTRTGKTKEVNGKEVCE